jgi:hypothetical protein
MSDVRNLACCGCKTSTRVVPPASPTLESSYGTHCSCNSGRGRFGCLKTHQNVPKHKHTHTHTQLQHVAQKGRMAMADGGSEMLNLSPCTHGEQHSTVHRAFVMQNCSSFSFCAAGSISARIRIRHEKRFRNLQKVVWMSCKDALLPSVAGVASRSANGAGS